MKQEHPDWHKKKVIVLERDNYQCVICGDKETEMEAQVIKREFSKKWQEDIANLQTQCKHCTSLRSFIGPEWDKMVADLITLEKDRCPNCGGPNYTLVLHNTPGEYTGIMELHLHNDVWSVDHNVAAFDVARWFDILKNLNLLDNDNKL